MTPNKLENVRRRIRVFLDQGGAICPVRILPYYSEHPDKIVAVFDAMVEDGELREVGSETPAHYRVFVRTREAGNRRRTE